MRRILTDQARARQSHKRGGGAQLVSLDEAPLVLPESHPEVLAVDGALHALAKVDLRKSQVVEMRFFGGLSVEETAEVLKVSPDTVVRDWRLAMIWASFLVRRLTCIRWLGTYICSISLESDGRAMIPRVPHSGCISSPASILRYSCARTRRDSAPR